MILTSVPYGTVEPWWKAAFECTVFALGILWAIEGLLSGSWRTGGFPILLPVLALVAFSFLQILPLGHTVSADPRVGYKLWYSISADPYETRGFAFQLLALTLAGALMFRYASNERQALTVIQVIIGIAVVSAIYGVLRQTTQHKVGFLLPLIKPDQGYGQFVNKNHFSFLMEMALGLIIGLVAGGGVARERSLIYLATSMPIWTALVLSNSRGGLLAMLVQLIFAVVMVPTIFPVREFRRPEQRGMAKVRRLLGSMPLRVALVGVLVGVVTLGTVLVGGDRLVTNLEAVRGEFDPAVIELRQGTSRHEIWRATWRMIRANPVAGVGMGGYWAAVPTYHDASGSMVPQEAHNDYLELLADGGIIGVALGVWFVVVLLRRTKANLRSASAVRRAACFGAAVGITGVAVHSLVDFGLHMIANALVFTTLIVIAAADKSQPQTTQTARTES